MLRFEIVDDKYSGMVANMIRESFAEQAKILGIRHLQKNNKPAFGLFCAMLHCHIPYIG